MGAINVADILTMQDLANGHLDVKALGEAANGDENTIVTTRTGNTYPSAKRAINIMFQNGGLPAAPFETKALMEASELIDGAYAVVTEDGSNSGLYIKKSGVWSFSDYNAITKYNRYNLQLLPDSTDVFTLPVGQYTIASIASGVTFENMPNVLRPYGRIDVRYTAGTNKEIVFTPYGRDNERFSIRFYDGGANTGWQTLTSKEDLLTLIASDYTTKSDANGSFDKLVEIALSGGELVEVGGSATDSAVAGQAVYPAAVLGVNGVSPSRVIVFNTVTLRLFADINTRVEYLVYTGDAVRDNDESKFVPSTQIKNYSYRGEIDLSSSDRVKDLKLPFNITLPPNTPYVIVFQRLDKGNIQLGYRRDGTITGTSFCMSRDPIDFDSPISTAHINNAAASLQFIQAPYRLKLVSSNVGETDASTPVPILPPKLYATAGLELPIYTETAMLYPSDMYHYDYTCYFGQQYNKGWRMTPTNTQDLTTFLKLDIHDKHTSKLVGTSSTYLTITPSSKTGNASVMLIGDSLINAGHISQRIADVSSTNSFKVSLLGTRGSGDAKHEGRGGWTVDYYTTAGAKNYKFMVSGVVTPPAINSTEYTHNGITYRVQEVAISSGSGYIVCSSTASVSALGAGVLTKSNSGTGDASISFSSMTSTNPNPFWNNGSLDFNNYFSSNSISKPDVAVISLGINDVFGAMSDSEAVNISTTALGKLQQFIAKFKADSAGTLFAVCMQPSFADQDAFGINYGTSQTSWRASRNIKLWNKTVIEFFGNKESESIYVVGSGLSVDVFDNYPVIERAINAHNSETELVQSNGVHPDVSGYKQIGDAMFAFIKAVS